MLLEINTKDSICWIRDMDMDSIDGLMAISIMGSLSINLGKDMEKWYGIQERFIRGNGKMVSKMVLENCFFNQKELKLSL